MLKRVFLIIIAIPFFMACEAPTTGTEMHDRDNDTERDEGLPERTQEDRGAQQQETERTTDSENR